MEGLLCFWGWNEPNTKRMINHLVDLTGIITWKTLDRNADNEPDYVLDLTDIDISTKIGRTFNAIAYYSGWPPAIPHGIRNLDRCLLENGLLIFTQQMCQPLFNVSGIYITIPEDKQTDFNKNLVKWIVPHYTYVSTAPDIPHPGLNQNIFMKNSKNFIYIHSE